MKLLAGMSVTVVLGLLALTVWALESGGVAVIETRMADGSDRSTHVWFAESDKELWLEAGTPENGWYEDIQRESVVSFSSSERSGRFHAEPLPGDSAHRRIRSLLREKYGFRDWWIGFIFDTSRSIAVKLVPSSAKAAVFGLEREAA